MNHTKIIEGGDESIHESDQMLAVLKASLRKEKLESILQYLERTKEGKRIASTEGDKIILVKKIQDDVIHCLNHGPCHEWISHMQSVDFSKIGNPTTPQAHCLHANTQSLVTAITSIASATSTGIFWNSIESAYIAASNLNNFYAEGIHF